MDGIDGCDDLMMALICACGVLRDVMSGGCVR
jgi:hypothetical protein